MKTQVVIIGGGPAGAAASMYLSRLGIENVIVEKVTFPRYHIGESMSGECGAVIRHLGLEAEMKRRGYPEKQGVKVWGPTGTEPWWVEVAARDENWELQPQFTWQMIRADFDQMMLDEAVKRGATLMYGRATRPLVAEDRAVRGVEVLPADGGLLKIEAELTLDCSGQASFLANHGVTGPKYLGNYDKQIAVFSQVANTIRDNGPDMRKDHPDNTLIFYKSKYHWGWFIPLTSELVSVGIVTPASYFLGKNESKPDYIRREMREMNPELSRRVPDLTLQEDVHVIPNYSFQVRDFTGRGYMCIGDSHRFVDPIFSFGLYIAVKEAQLAAPVIRDYLNGVGRDLEDPFADFELHLEKGIDVLEDMVDLFWEQPFGFAAFAHRRYKGEVMDIFAGRIYERQPNSATTAFRNMLGRERDYYNMDLYSVPIGSRYHPERAPLWQPDSLVPGTEQWILD